MSNCDAPVKLEEERITGEMWTLKMRDSHGREYGGSRSQRKESWSSMKDTAWRSK